MADTNTTFEKTMTFATNLRPQVINTDTPRGTVGSSTNHWEKMYSQNYYLKNKAHLVYNDTDDSIDFVFDN